MHYDLHKQSETEAYQMPNAHHPQLRPLVDEPPDRSLTDSGLRIVHIMRAHNHALTSIRPQSSFQTRGSNQLQAHPLLPSTNVEKSTWCTVLSLRQKAKNNS